MLTLFIILIIALSAFILIRSSEVVIYSIKKFAKDAKVGVFAISSVILAVGTSFPELFVGITSALEQSSELALGVVLGSNIANIAFIGGISALTAGRVHVSGQILKKDVWISFVAGLAPIVFLIDGVLSRVDGLVLLVLYLAYAAGFFRSASVKEGNGQTDENLFYRMLSKIKNSENIQKSMAIDLGRLFIGIALMILSADSIVKLSGYLALKINIPVFLIGLIFLAIGTSLPELVLSLKSLREHEPSMFFGNLLGSTVANSTLIVGLAALIWPVRISNIYSYFFAFLAYILVFGLFIVFVRSKKRLDRWEGVVLLSVYMLFMLVELI